MEFLIVMFGLICRKHAVMKDAPTKPLREWSAQDMVQNKLVMPNCIEYWETATVIRVSAAFYQRCS